VILFGTFLASSGLFLVKLLLGEQFRGLAVVLVWPAITETIRAINSSFFTMGMARVDMHIILRPVVAAALISPILVYLLAPLSPLAGTGIALLTAGLTALFIMIPMTYRVLPVTWPLRRIAGAMTLGLSLVLVGRIAGVILSDTTLGTSLVVVSIAGAFMVMIQYLMARQWLRESYVAAR